MTTLTKTINSNSIITAKQSISSEVVKVFVRDDTTNAWHYIRGAEDFWATKTLNDMSQFSFNFNVIDSTLRNIVKRRAKVLVYLKDHMFLKGRIRKISYISNYLAKAEGMGMEQDLMNKELYDTTYQLDNDPTRVEYTDINSNTIAKRLLSLNSDGASPWIIEPLNSGAIATYGSLTIRFERYNRLNSLRDLSDAINQDWWVSHSADYETDYFNIADRGTTPGYTFRYTGVNANCNITSKQSDEDGIMNYITFVGYSEGVNQLKTVVYNMSETFTDLNEELTSSDTTITLEDASSFPNSGTIRIMQEQITYTGKSGNDLTGCTRGANSTTALSHKKGCFVEKHTAWTTQETLQNNSDAGSSIGLYGICSHTEVYKNIRDRETLELLASYFLATHKDEFERIEVQSSYIYNTLNNVGLGDTVTLVDSTTGANADYNVVSLGLSGEYGSYKLTVGLSHKSIELMNQLERLLKQSEDANQFMQGATNLWGDTQSDNANATTPLILQFYVPDNIQDADGNSRINQVRLSYATKDIKTYTGDLTGETGAAYTAAGMTNASSLTNADMTNANSVTNADMTNVSQLLFGNYDVEVDYEVVDTNNTDWTLACTLPGCTLPGGASTADTSIYYVYITSNVNNDFLQFIIYNFTDLESLFQDTAYISDDYYTGVDRMHFLASYFVPGSAQYNKSISMRVKSAGTAANTIGITLVHYLTGKHTHSNTFDDANHQNPNTFDDANHTNSNTFDDETHTNPAGTLDAGYDLGQTTTVSTNTVIKIYNSANTLLWNSGNRGQILETDIDISSYITTSDYYRIEIYPNSDAYMFGTVYLKGGIES